MPLTVITLEFIENLERLRPNAIHLNLSKNQLTSLSYLSRLQSLEIINLAHNCLTDLVGIETLANLKELDASYNFISSCEGLRPGFPKLEVLNLAHNRIHHPSDIQYFKDLEHLTSLTLEGNPIMHQYQTQVTKTTKLELPTNVDGHHLATKRRETQGQLKDDISQPRHAQQPVIGSRMFYLDEAEKKNYMNLLSRCNHNYALDVSPISTTRTLSSTLEQEQNIEEQTKEGALEPEEENLEERESASVAQHPMMISGDATPTREPTTQVLEPRINPTMPNAPPRLGGSTSSGQGFENQNIHLLTERVSALQRILELQETQLSIAASTDDDDDRHASTYRQVLSEWRMQVFQLLVRNQRLETRQSQDQHTYETQESKFKTLCRKTELEAQVWLEKVHDLETKVRLQEHDMKTLTDQSSTRQTQSIKILRQLERHKTLVWTMSQRVVEWSESREFRHQTAQLEYAAERLEHFHHRLYSMSERLSTMKDLLQSKDIFLRNSQAALEAEKRMFVLQQQNNRASTKQQPNVMNLLSCPLPMHGLHPDCEAAMQMAFHQLDHYRVGLVPKDDFYHQLAKDQYVAQMMASRQPPDGLERWQAMLGVMKQVFRDEISSSRITWGEVLLCFVPSSSVEAQTQAPKQEQTRVVEHRSENEEVPPPFPFHKRTQLDQKTTTVASVAELRSLSREQLLKECQALTKERQALRQRIQMDSHVLRHHIQSKSTDQLWEEKLSDLILRLAATKEETRTVTAEKLDLEAQVQQLHEQARESQAQKEQTVHECEQRLEELTKRDQVREKETRETLEQERRSMELEQHESQAQQRQLKSEVMKATVRVSQLERALERQRTQHETQEQRKVQYLEDRCQQKERDIVKLRRERNALLASLREQEQQKPRAISNDLPSPIERKRMMVPIRTAESCADESLESMKEPVKAVESETPPRDTTDLPMHQHLISKLDDLEALSEFLMDDDNDDEKQDELSST